MPSVKVSKEKIIQSLLESSFDSSVGGTSLADIAGKLGIKKASLYNHYESRDAIIKDTLRYCSESLEKTTFIPTEIDAAAKKYPTEVIFKGIVNRWFKIFSREPLFQIYIFLESEKYFSSEAQRIVAKTRDRMIYGSKVALESLAAAGKIAQDSIDSYDRWSKTFVSALRDSLDNFLAHKKESIRKNPDSSAGSLFADLASDEPDFSKLNATVDQLCSYLKK